MQFLHRQQIIFTHILNIYGHHCHQLFIKLLSDRKDDFDIIFYFIILILVINYLYKLKNNIGDKRNH
jgi:hypothetical protein